jgi:hypothetical protein
VTRSRSVENKCKQQTREVIADTKTMAAIDMKQIYMGPNSKQLESCKLLSETWMQLSVSMLTLKYTSQNYRTTVTEGTEKTKILA